MASHMQGQDDFNMFPQYMTEPPAKRPRQCEHQTPMMPALPVEVAKGNNKYGSKGTVRCEKCQKRKGKCTFTSAQDPCDYCAARILPCGPKLPTARKRLEQGIGAVMMGAAAITTPVLTLQIPEQHDTYSLSSASPHERGYSPSPYPASGNGSYAGVAGIPLPSDIVQPWSQEHSRSTSAISTPISRSPTKSKSPSSPPPRYDMPVSSLAGAVVPHVAAMLPSWSFPIPQTQEEFDEDWEKWICYDQSPSPTIKGFGEQLRRFNRMLRAPRAMVGRRLAGKWDDENAPGDGGMKSSIKSSVKSSPSIICT